MQPYTGDPNAENAKGRTALARAATHNQVDAVRLLLSLPRIDVNFGARPPLWWCCENHDCDDPTLARVLIEAGASTSMRVLGGAFDQELALHAVCHGRYEGIQVPTLTTRRQEWAG